MIEEKLAGVRPLELVLVSDEDDRFIESGSVYIEGGRIEQPIKPMIRFGAQVRGYDGRVVGMLSTGDLIVQESRLHYPTVISLLGGIIELPSSQRHFEEDLRKAATRAAKIEETAKLRGRPEITGAWVSSTVTEKVAIEMFDPSLAV